MRVVAAVGLTVLATVLLAACATGEAGVVAPDRVKAESFLASPLPEMLRDDEELLLLIHGSGEGPSAWPARVQAALAGRGSRDSRRIVRVDWASAAADRIVAPRRGEQIGAELARYLLRSFSPPGAITVVSHSAGAFVAHGFACELRRQEGGPVRARGAGRGRDWTEPIVTQLFLDPFLARPPLRWRYGIRRFGTCADRAFAWVNTGDPVPFTSGFPRHAEGRDLTGREDLRSLAAGLTDSEAPGHWIPVAAFISMIEDTEPGVSIGQALASGQHALSALHEDVYLLRFMRSF